MREVYYVLKKLNNLGLCSFSGVRSFIPKVIQKSRNDTLLNSRSVWSRRLIAADQRVNCMITVEIISF